jgi:hypothetical protein
MPKLGEGSTKWNAFVRFIHYSLQPETIQHSSKKETLPCILLILMLNKPTVLDAKLNTGK